MRCSDLFFAGTVLFADKLWPSLSTALEPIGTYHC